MKALLLNGSPHSHGCTFTALSEVAKAFPMNFSSSGTNPFMDVSPAAIAGRTKPAFSRMMSCRRSWKQ